MIQHLWCRWEKAHVCVTKRNLKGKLVTVPPTHCSWTGSLWLWQTLLGNQVLLCSGRVECPSYCDSSVAQECMKSVVYSQSQLPRTALTVPACCTYPVVKVQLSHWEGGRERCGKFQPIRNSCTLCRVFCLDTQLPRGWNLTQLTLGTLGENSFHFQGVKPSRLFCNQIVTLGSGERSRNSRKTQMQILFLHS